MISKLRKIIYSRIEVLLGVVVIIALLVIFAGGDSKDSPVTIEEVVYDYNHFDDISIEAHSAFVWDVNKQEALFGVNENVQLPLASLTKLMTAIAADDILPEESVVTIDGTALIAEGDSGLYENERWSFKDLIRFTLMVSSNDGASAVANVAGVFKNDFPSRDEDNNKSFVQAMN